MDKHLQRLYDGFDRLFADIRATCIGCGFHDCEGYVWLLAEEAETLYDREVPVVEINDNLQFIHSFEEVDGQIIVDKPKPPCRLRDEDGRCSVYDVRPLVCRMYPVGLANHEDSLTLVLHQDCQFSLDLPGNKKNEFLHAVLGILRSVPSSTIKEIAETYKEIDAISAFPDGPNSYELLISIEDLLSNE